MTKTITPAEARRLMDEGALIVDVRAPDEHARLKVPGALNLPLERLSQGVPGADKHRAIIYHCQSGARTAAAAPALAAAAGSCEAYVVEGGIAAWRAAGLPVEEDRRQPLPLMRQVQITAGLLIVLGVVLGYLVGPAWFLLAGFVGAGLTFAGITGFCGMARLLAVMPWNRSAGGAAA